MGLGFRDFRLGKYVLRDCSYHSPLCNKTRGSDLEWPWSLVRPTCDEKQEIQIIFFQMKQTVWVWNRSTHGSDLSVDATARKDFHRDPILDRPQGLNP